MTTETEAENVTPWNFEQDPESLMGMIEALTLASPSPLMPEAILEILTQAEITLDPAFLQSAIDSLISRYRDGEKGNSGFELVQVAGGLAFRTKSKFGPFVRALFKEKPQKLSASQLEVLSVIAYRQPITRSEVEDIRGVDCSGSMRRLLNVKLIKILGKSNGLGRPLLYGTTKEFLEFFGLNSLHDLPSLREFEELNKADSTAEALPELSDTVEVMDLFEGHESAKTNYEERERLSREALESLDKALHHVANVAEKLQNHPSAI